MSGHSKWAQIKRKKEVTDKKRGKLITQFAKIIALAARDGADPEHNVKLKLAISRAKSFNIPSDTIDRAVERGSGAKEGEGFTEQNYEAYGPAGSAFIIHTITDNKNRTVSDLKHTLSEYGGKLAQSGGVSWMFEEHGVIELMVPEDKREEAEMLAIDQDARDIQTNEDMAVVYTKPSALHAVQVAFKDAGFEVRDSYMEMVAKDTLTLEGENLQKYNELHEALEDYDDVNGVYTNVQSS